MSETRGISQQCVRNTSSVHSGKQHAGTSFYAKSTLIYQTLNLSLSWPPGELAQEKGSNRKSKRSLLDVIGDLEREGVLARSQDLGYSTAGGSGDAGIGSASDSGDFGALACGPGFPHSPETHTARGRSSSAHRGKGVGSGLGASHASGSSAQPEVAERASSINLASLSRKGGASGTGAGRGCSTGTSPGGGWQRTMHLPGSSVPVSPFDGAWTSPNAQWHTLAVTNQPPSSLGSSPATGRGRGVSGDFSRDSIETVGSSKAPHALGGVGNPGLALPAKSDLSGWKPVPAGLSKHKYSSFRCTAPSTSAWMIPYTLDPINSSILYRLSVRSIREASSCVDLCIISLFSMGNNTQRQFCSITGMQIWTLISTVPINAAVIPAVGF